MRMKTAISRGSLSVILCLSILGGSADGAEDRLAWRFKPGEVLRYEYRLKSESEVKATGVVQAGPKTSEVELSMDLSWTVDRVDADGTATISQRVERLRASFSRGMAIGDPVRAAYDSGDRTTVNNIWSAMMDDAIRPLIGEPYTLKMDVQGRVDDVKLPEAAVRAWKAQPWLAETKDAPFASLFSTDGFGPILAPVLPELPARRPGEGGRWESSWRAGPGDRLRLRDPYTASGSEGTSVKYTAKTVATPGDPEVFPLIPPAPLAIAMIVSWGTEDVKFDRGRFAQKAGEATVTFDSAAGHLVSSTRDLAYGVDADYHYSAKKDERKSGSVNSSFHLRASMTRVPRDR